MTFLLGVIVLFAALSAVIAAGQAVAINRVAPAGGFGWRKWLFGWWRFPAIDAMAGEAGAANAGIYKRAIIAGIVFLVLGLILSGWSVSQRSGGTAFLLPHLTNAVRFDTAQLQHSILRPVAPMPGAILVES